MSVYALSGSLDAHVGAGGVLDRLELAVAGAPRLHLPAAEFRDPLAPFGPPGSGMLHSTREPLVGRSRRRGVLIIDRPVAVLLGGRRVDHPGDVTRGREAELDRAAIEPGRREGRLPRRDVILAGR